MPEEQEVSYPLTEPLEETQPFLPQEPSLILRSLLSNRLTATLAYGLDLVAEEGLILRPRVCVRATKHGTQEGQWLQCSL